MNEISPVVSVIVPFYNRIAYLYATVESVLSQSLSDWELILVNDGSVESLPKRLLNYFDNFKISCLYQSNQGNAAARNTGIRQAHGNYVICLDSDDAWRPEMLESTVAFLESHTEVDVVYTQVQAIGANGQRLPRPIGPEPRRGDLLEPLLMGMPLLPSSALVRRRCFEQWGVYTPGLDDWELWLRWAARGCRFACIEQPLLYYRIHDQNFNLDWERRREAHFRMLDTFFAMEDLPDAVWRLQERAYANQHFHFAVLAEQIGQQEDGAAEFKQAVLRHPDYLTDLDFYTRFACGHQGRIDAGTARNLDLERAESTLLRALDRLFESLDLSETLADRRGMAYGWAYLALARLAYGVAHDMALARRHLWCAVRAWPVCIWRTDWGLWLARGVVGYDTLQRVKRILHLEVSHAHS